jgi:hypothetical protein
MNRRVFLGILPGLSLLLQALSANAAELVVAHLRIDGMT